MTLCDGQEQWFFENEIDILDENGNVLKKEDYRYENKNFINKIFKDLQYEKKYSVKDLLNPFNFLIWLIVSFKDNL